MFKESGIDPLARFRSMDEKVETLREAVSQVRDAREMIRASEASEVREKVLREEVLDFLDHATRQAANVIKDLQESKTTLTDARVRREMIEFLDHTREVAERLITDLKSERRKILQRAQATLKTEKPEKPGSGKGPARGAAAPARTPRSAKGEAPKERTPKAQGHARKPNEAAQASLKSIVEKPSRRKR
jgi:hypothetical protein